MLNAVKVISTELDELKRRIVKYLRLGKSDVQTSYETVPFGIDSHPLKDMIAIYGMTGEKGKTVIIGYLNRGRVAAIGETRIFSTDSDGALKTFIWLKNDGTIQIGGSTDFMVRYSKLEAAFNELNNKFNAFANAYVPGGPSAQGLPAAAQPSTADITGAKIAEIKTI
jgi:hypothetical protein